MSAPPLRARRNALRAFLVALTALGCSDGGRLKGVEHLDPRLLTRESSADVLAAMGTQWLDEVTVPDRDADLAPWQLRFAERVETASGVGVYVRGNVVNDQRVCLFIIRHLPGFTLRPLPNGARGTFHICDGGECTWYEFTKQIAAHLGATCDIQPCTSAEFPRPAKRPAYSVLDLTPTEEILGPMPHWKQNLAAVLDEIAQTTPH